MSESNERGRPCCSSGRRARPPRLYRGEDGEVDGRCLLEPRRATPDLRCVLGATCCPSWARSAWWWGIRCSLRASRARATVGSGGSTWVCLVPSADRSRYSRSPATPSAISARPSRCWARAAKTCRRLRRARLFRNVILHAEASLAGPPPRRQGQGEHQDHGGGRDHTTDVVLEQRHAEHDAPAALSAAHRAGRSGK